MHIAQPMMNDNNNNNTVEDVYVLKKKKKKREKRNTTTAHLLWANARQLLKHICRRAFLLKMTARVWTPGFLTRGSQVAGLLVILLNSATPTSQIRRSVRNCEALVWWWLSHEKYTMLRMHYIHRLIQCHFKSMQNSISQNMHMYFTS